MDRKPSGGQTKPSTGAGGQGGGVDGGGQSDGGFFASNCTGTTWMRVHLMGDTAIRNMFYGANCQLCQNTQLKVQRKNMDQ